MILNNNLLRNLYTKYRLNKKEFFKTSCPSPVKILEAIRNPSKKTRPTMDHVMDCNYCYLTFLFLKDVETAETCLLRTLDDKFSYKKTPLFNRFRPFFNPARLLRMLPYSVALLLGAVIIYGVIHFLFLMTSPTERSVNSSFSIFLVPSAESPEKLAYFLEWKPLPGIKFYEVKVFDSSLKTIWKTTASENECPLPTWVNEAIRRKENLFLSLDAITEDNASLHLWIGDIASIMALSPNKGPQSRRH